jgi:SAM-dependent methyltransferase
MSYVHGTDPDEQARLSRLNDMLNAATLRELALSGTEHILDVGAGLGQLTRAMSRTGARVLGIERSPEQIAEAHRQAALAGETIDLRPGDALALPLSASEWGSFDVAHARFLLEHVADPLAVVRQMVRAVRPGGRVILADDDHELLKFFPEPPGLSTVWHAYQRSYDRAGNDPIIGRRLPSLLHQAGAHPIRSTMIFFGACHGDPNFSPLLDNVAIILDRAAPAIAATALVTPAAITAAIAAILSLRTTPGAALWYSMPLAIAEVRPTG